MQAELLNSIYDALVERDTHEKSLAGMIEQRAARRSSRRSDGSADRRLSQQTLILRDRNRLLLKATSDAKSQPNGAPGAGDDRVRAAYAASLESQIATLRDELAAVYKTSSLNAQRLLEHTQTLREAEDKSRTETELIRSLRAEVEKLGRRAEDALGAKKEKEKAIEHLNDELATLQLEFGQLEQRNADLKVDNQAILQRWLDKLNEECVWALCHR